MPVSNPGGVIDESLGTYSSLAELVSTYPTASPGDFAIVTSDGHTYVWVDPTGWTDTGTAYFTPGPPGPPGQPGQPGPRGYPGVRVIESTVDYASPASSMVAAVSADCSILSVTASVESAWNGAGASLTVGVAADHSFLLGADDVDLGVLCEFTREHEFEGPFDVFVYVSPGAGATSGSAAVRVEIANKG